MSKFKFFVLWHLFLIVFCPLSFGAEPVVRISLPTEEEEFLSRFPLVYSYGSAQWVSSEPLRISRLPDGETPVVTLPYLKENPPPPIPYPSMALERKWEGTLVVAIEIRTDGTVGRWKAMRSSGHKLLDETAIRAVRTWRFEPARRGNQPIASCIQVPIHFVIEGKEKRR